MLRDGEAVRVTLGLANDMKRRRNEGRKKTRGQFARSSLFMVSFQRCPAAPFMSCHILICFANNLLESLSTSFISSA
eukprot:24548-Hanusia_phi.AAC.1